MTHRIYSDNLLSENISYPLNKDEIHYLINVLRLKHGDEYRIFNNNGEYLARIIAHNKKTYSTEIVKKLREPVATAPLTLAIAVIKSDRFMWAIEKTIELGVTKIIPVICHRSQYREINIERFKKCIKEATEQCERLDLAVITPPLYFEELLHNNRCIIAANEKEDYNNTISKITTELPQEATILIGPEGGFTDSELNLIIDNQQVISVSLGKNILRAETAAIVAITQYLVQQSK